MSESPFLTWKEAQRYLRVSRSTLYRLMWNGQLTGHKVGATWRFYRYEVEAVAKQQETCTLPPLALEQVV